MTAATGHIELDRTVESIQVGRRHRRDLGDLDALAASIERDGLLQPITITPDGLLVCGVRRLAAIHGSAPHVLLASATIANPEEALAATLGAELEGIRDDASAQPPRTLAVWNPAPIAPCLIYPSPRHHDRTRYLLQAFC